METIRIEKGRIHNLPYHNMANWFFVQFREEQDHARILMNYINSRDVRFLFTKVFSWGCLTNAVRQLQNNGSRLCTRVGSRRIIKV